MALRDFLSAEKQVASDTGWSDKKMPKTGRRFPLTKARNFRLGSGWRWCALEIDAEGRSYRLLVAYNPLKENFLALLGTAVSAEESLVLASLESHGSHPGWHVHGCCATVGSAAFGRLRYPEMVRIPDGKRPHRVCRFPGNDSEALDVVGRHFRIPALVSSQGSLL